MQDKPPQSHIHLPEILSDIGFYGKEPLWQFLQLSLIHIFTQHKIAIIRNGIWPEASLHFLWNKGIIKSSLRTVDVYLSVLDFNSLSRKSDYTFNEKLAFIIRILENYNVKALWILDLLGNLMSKQIQIDTCLLYTSRCV